jgi:hypothetical protein
MIDLLATAVNSDFCIPFFQHTAILDLDGSSSTSFFGVYDGHGGLIFFLILLEHVPKVSAVSITDYFVRLLKDLIQYMMKQLRNDATVKYTCSSYAIEHVLRPHKDNVNDAKIYIERGQTIILTFFGGGRGACQHYVQNQYFSVCFFVPVIYTYYRDL